MIAELLDYPAIYHPDPADAEAAVATLRRTQASGLVGTWVPMAVMGDQAVWTVVVRGQPVGVRFSEQEARDELLARLAVGT